MRKHLKSVKWLLFWVILALGFCGWVYTCMGEEKALEFLGGYLIELSLSMDNLFVFITIFAGFGIREKAQHRALNYGIAGAIVLRFLFIFFGLQLVEQFQWTLYVFGAMLILNGLKMFKEEKEQNPCEHWLIRMLARVLPMTVHLSGDRFAVRDKNGRLLFTPLFAAVCLVECSDILFAMDSVPAVFSVSTDLLLVYVSNIFAVLGLRQFYFVLEHLHQRFRYVKYGIAMILMFTGMKLAGAAFGWYVPVFSSIVVIGGILMLSICVSSVLSPALPKN